MVLQLQNFKPATYLKLQNHIRHIPFKEVRTSEMVKWVNVLAMQDSLLEFYP